MVGDKNDPSVFWLMEMESNAAAAYQWTKKRNLSRPFHYESTTYANRTRTSTPSCTPTPARVKQLAAQRPDMPLILCGYQHADGELRWRAERVLGTSSTPVPMRRARLCGTGVDQGIRLPVPVEHPANMQ